MPDLFSFDYAVLRVVPRVEREEFINAGVILFCLQRRYLGVQIEIKAERLLALCPGTDIDDIRQRALAFRRICAGDPAAGPIAELSLRERFGWLVAPRSTLIQTSAVHSGLCAEPEPTLQRLFAELC